MFRGARGLEWMLLAICAVLALLLLINIKRQQRKEA